MELSYILLSVVCVMFAVISYNFYKRLWNPVLICSGMLWLSSTLACMEDAGKAKMSNALFWIVCGTITLNLSFMFSQTMVAPRIQKKNNNVVYKKHFLRTGSTLCCLFAALAAILSLYEVLQISHGFWNIFYNSTWVRMQYLERSSSKFFSLVGVFVSMNFYVLFMILPYAVKAKCPFAKIKLLFVVACRLFSSLITMSKEAFIIDIVILITAFVSTLRNSHEEFVFFRRYAAIFAGAIAGLLAVVAFQRNYIGGGRYSNYFEAICGTLYEYIGCPITGFSELILYQSKYYMGQQCFRPFFNILSYVGIVKRISIVQDAVIGTINVYSIFGNMFNDFSFFGIILISMIIGLLMGALYQKWNKKISGITINAILIMTMFFSYYDYKLMQTVYVFTMVYAVLFEKIFYRKIYDNKG